MTGSIHSNITIGPVYLRISNLERSIAFYQSALGFKVHKKLPDVAFLGAGGPNLLVLTESSIARQYRSTTGLYHFAILVPSRLEFALSLDNLAATGTPVQGFADHLVSEAIYLVDPDGNGIEIYRDRPRSDWSYRDGQLEMATLPLNTDNILNSLSGQDGPWLGLSPETRVGHVHLKVASVDKAERFYTELLGFDLVTRYGSSASFVSAGGYHHHIGFNSWESAGAPPLPTDALGLQWFIIEVADEMECDAIITRLHLERIELKKVESGMFLRDPSGNGIVLRTKVDAS